MSTNQKITPFLWFDNNAEEAVKFYTSIFPNAELKSLKYWPEGSGRPPKSVQSGVFSLDGLQFHAFDAGPHFTFNPSISFFVVLENKEAVDTLWNHLSEGGQVIMALDKYPWSDHYGWLIDRFGLAWQIMKGELKPDESSISPLLFFTGEQRGKAAEAIELYTSVFDHSGNEDISKYTEDEGEPAGMIKHALFELHGQTFRAMDAGNDAPFAFNEAISFFVPCADQAEVDYYWNKLAADPTKGNCGWLKDPFGVSWQIVPQYLMDKLSSGEPQRVQNMMAALMKMVKLEIAELEAAYDQPLI